MKAKQTLLFIFLLSPLLLRADEAFAWRGNPGDGNWQWPARTHITEAFPPVSPFLTGQIQPGAPAPHVPITYESGQTVWLDEAVRGRPTILVVFQSYTCGHCHWQYFQMMQTSAEIEKLGFRYLGMARIGKTGAGVYDDVLEKKYAGAKGKDADNYRAAAAAPDLPIPLILDEDGRVGEALGISFPADHPIHLSYPQRGDMLWLGLNGDGGGWYGPAVIVFGADGRVLYSWHYNDHKVRISAQTLVAIAEYCRTEPAMETDLQEALEHPERVLRLSLAGRGLKTLPPELFSLTHLEELILADNELEELPSAIGTLQKLKRLDISRNQLAELPAAIGQLQDLRDLCVLGNSLTRLPESVGNLKNLVRLNAMFNPIETLPDSIGNLSRLEALHLYGHRMESLPESIGNCSELKILFLPGTKPGGKNDSSGRCVGLKRLPESIGRLSRLVELNLIFNDLETLPESIGGLQSLQMLMLNENQLRELPDSLGNIPKISTLYSEHLHLRGNRLTRLPESLGNVQSLNGLDVRDNLLESIPAGIIRKTGWAGIYADRNQMRELPPGIMQSRDCINLRFSGNRIESLPENFFAPAETMRWGVVDLSSNRITRLPEAWEPSRLPHLHHLDLRGNPLEEIPAHFKNSKFMR